MGRYDVPAIINYILLTTSRTKLIYIGHSMGCAVFFVAMITHPELNDKIEVMVALAPATSLDHMTSPIRFFAPFVGPLEVCLLKKVLISTLRYLAFDFIIADIF